MRQPGRLTRCRSVMTRSMPWPYFRKTRSTPCLPSSVSRKLAMYPSSLRMRAISIFSLEDGTSTLGSFARTPFRIRVIMSATGSVMFIGNTSRRSRLPTGLDHSRDVPRERLQPEADAAELELPQVTTGAAADAAARVFADGELRLARRLGDQRELGH